MNGSGDLDDDGVLDRVLVDDGVGVFEDVSDMVGVFDGVIELVGDLDIVVDGVLVGDGVIEMVGESETVGVIDDVFDCALAGATSSASARSARVSNEVPGRGPAGRARRGGVAIGAAPRGGRDGRSIDQRLRRRFSRE